MKRTKLELGLADFCSMEDTIFDVRIILTSENLTSSPSSERCQLDLRSLRDDTHPSEERSGWEELMNAVLLTPHNRRQDVSTSKIHRLDSFEVSLYIHIRDQSTFLTGSATLWKVCGTSDLLGFPRTLHFRPRQGYLIGRTVHHA